MGETRPDAVTLDGAGPVYDQIRRAIRDRIVGGAWPPGTSVPPEHALMAQLGASRMTVHRALAQLARDGLITRRRRSGTVVASPAASHALLEIVSISQEVDRLGQRYAHEILSRDEGKPSAELADRFCLEPSAAVLHLLVLHRADGKPHGLEERVIHLSTVPAAAEETFADTPPGDWLLQRSGWSQAEHAITAVAAAPNEAAMLDVPRGEPCLLVERRTWTKDRHVTAVRLLYPGRRHRFVGRFGPYARHGDPHD